MDKQKILETVTPEVKKELKSPYSAVLCPPEDLRVVPKGQGTDGSKKFTIYGYVDSQNSYGAMMRTDFEYDVSELSDGTYSVVEGGVGDRTPTARKAQIEAQAKMNMERVTKADNKADIKTVYWGLDNAGNPDKYTEEEVTQLDGPLFDEILQHVKRISHMDDDEIEDDVEDFHEEE